MKLIRQVLDSTGTADLVDRRVCDLSGGEIQRVMLSLAVNPVPDILLLDEPLSGVARSGLAGLYAPETDLRRTNDITILLISHDLDLVAKYADKVILIDRGIAAEGTPREVYNSSAFMDLFGKTGVLDI